MRTATIVIIGLVATVLTACAGSMADSASISGTVTYLQRIALPQGAMLTVELVDISLADAPAVTLGAYSSQPDTQVPLPFTIAYDPADIIDNHTYALQAQIHDAQGKLWFRNTTKFLVLTNGQPSDKVEIVLDMVSGQ